MVAPQSAAVHCVSGSSDKLDIFVTATDGGASTAAWEPDFADGWHGWWHITGVQAAPGAAVTAVSRGSDKLDIFVVGTDNRVYTAAWDPTLPMAGMAGGEWVHSPSERFRGSPAGWCKSGSSS